MLSKLALLQSTAVLVAWLIVVLLYPPLSSLLGVHAGALVYVPVVAAANWDAKLSALAYVLGIVLVVVIHGVPAELFEPAFLMHLGFALVLSVILARLCTEARTRAQQQVKLELLTGRLAYHEQHDPLTGVINRAAFQAEFERRAKAAPTKLTALCLIDLDDFKALNDSFGQTVGDLLLAQVARRLAEVTSAADVLARLRGMSSRCSRPWRAWGKRTISLQTCWRSSTNLLPSRARVFLSSRASESVFFRATVIFWTSC